MLIELKGIFKAYKIHGRKVDVLSDFYFSADRGEMVAVTGESGSGKSTILNIIGGTLSADAGNILYDSERLNIKSKKDMDIYRKKHIGFIVQDFALIADDNNQAIT